MAAAFVSCVPKIVLIDLDRRAAKAVATDMHYGVALVSPGSIRYATTATLPMPVPRSSPAAS